MLCISYTIYCILMSVLLIPWISRLGISNAKKDLIHALKWLKTQLPRKNTCISMNTKGPFGRVH